MSIRSELARLRKQLPPLPGEKCQCGYRVVIFRDVPHAPQEVPERCPMCDGADPHATIWITEAVERDPVTGELVVVDV
jgi:hypothetical protein